MENNYGWDWGKDIEGALAFLKRQDDIDFDRIGAVGLSTGADALIEVAARRDDINARALDGAAAASYEDWHRLRGIELAAAPGWMMFTTIHVLSGDPPGTALEDLMPRIKAPTLLISSEEADEQKFNVMYEQAARRSVEHWNLPDAQHTRAIRQHTTEYERCVVGHFDQALASAETKQELP